MKGLTIFSGIQRIVVGHATALLDFLPSSHNNYKQTVINNTKLKAKDFNFSPRILFGGKTMRQNAFHEEITQLIEKFQIEQLCDLFSDDGFLWEVKGTGNLSAIYTSKEEYFNKALYQLSQCIQKGATISVLESFSVNNALILELEGNMTTLSGKPYNNQYCWIIKTEQNKIVSITAYLDTLLLERVMEEAE